MRQGTFKTKVSKRWLTLILPLAWRNLWRNKKRTLLTMLAISIAVFSMVVLGAFMRAWSEASLDEAINNLTGHIQLHHPNFLNDPAIGHRMDRIEPAVWQLLAENPEVRHASRIRVPAMLRTARESAPVELIGIEPEREKSLSFIAGAIRQGHYFTQSDIHLSGSSSSASPVNGIIIGQKLARRLQIKIGQRLVLLAQNKDGKIVERGIPLIGVFSSQPTMEQTRVFMTLTSTQKMLGIGADISELVIRMPALEQVKPFVRQLSQHTHWQVKSWDELQPFTKAMMEMSEGSIYIWIVVSFAIVSFGLINTLLMAVYERMREIGLLQALGMPPALMLGQFLFESAIMLLISIVMGLIAGSLLVVAFADGLHLGIGASYFGAAQTVYPKLDIAELGLIATMVILLGLAASLYPAFKASRQVPVEILARATN